MIDKLNAVLTAYLRRPDVGERLAALGEFLRFIPAEIAKWAQVVRDAGITPE